MANCEIYDYLFEAGHAQFVCPSVGPEADSEFRLSKNRRLTITNASGKKNVQWVLPPQHLRLPFLGSSRYLFRRLLLPLSAPPASSSGASRLLFRRLPLTLKRRRRRQTMWIR